MKIMNLFPTPVAFFDLARPITIAENKYIQELETRANLGNTTSVNNYVLSNEPLQELKQFFTNCLEEYITNIYSPINKLNMKITQSWVNYTEPEEYHHKHNHPNSFVSGVFYVKTNNATDKIYFYKDGYQQLKILAKEYNVYNSDSWWFEATQGRLILFPSSLVHMVSPTSQNSDTRISISFNTFPVGQIGENSELTELFLGDNYV